MTFYHVTLTEQERSQLEALKSKGYHRPQKVLNALILLNCNDDPINQAVQLAIRLTRFLASMTGKSIG